MARGLRYFLADQPLHVIQRGHNRAAIFARPQDYRVFRRYLGEAAARHGLAVHAYVLMTNHVHLLATPGAETSLPRAMQSLGRRYVGYFNRAYERSGTLWEGRYRVAPIDSEAYLLVCSRYIELNPVRAGMVYGPGDYPWSSYRRNAAGRADDLVTPHALYGALGGAAEARQAAYRVLFQAVLDEDQLTAIREATNRGWGLGTDAFRAKLARLSGRPAGPRPHGRPPKRGLGSAQAGAGERNPLCFSSVPPCPRGEPLFGFGQTIPCKGRWWRGGRAGRFRCSASRDFHNVLDLF